MDVEAVLDSADKGEITAVHARLLKFLSDPRHYLRSVGKTPFPDLGLPLARHKAILTAIPELPEDDDTIKELIDELHDMGLIDDNSVSLKTGMSVDGAYREVTTPLGNEFLRRVSQL